MAYNNGKVTICSSFFVLSQYLWLGHVRKQFSKTSLTPSHSWASHSEFYLHRCMPFHFKSTFTKSDVKIYANILRMHSVDMPYIYHISLHTVWKQSIGCAWNFICKISLDTYVLHANQHFFLFFWIYVHAYIHKTFYAWHAALTSKIKFVLHYIYYILYLYTFRARSEHFALWRIIERRLPRKPRRRRPFCSVLIFPLVNYVCTFIHTYVFMIWHCKGSHCFPIRVLHGRQSARSSWQKFSQPLTGSHIALTNLSRFKWPQLTLLMLYVNTKYDFKHSETARCIGAYFNFYWVDVHMSVWCIVIFCNMQFILVVMFCKFHTQNYLIKLLRLIYTINCFFLIAIDHRVQIFHSGLIIRHFYSTYGLGGRYDSNCSFF